MEELGQVIVSEEMVLEKTDVESGTIVERITVVTSHDDPENPVSEIVKHEFYDTDGTHIKTLEGGNDGTNNRI
jgi:hypothetical protein